MLSIWFWSQFFPKCLCLLFCVRLVEQKQWKDGWHLRNIVKNKEFLFFLICFEVFIFCELHKEWHIIHFLIKDLFPPVFLFSLPNTVSSALLSAWVQIPPFVARQTATPLQLGWHAHISCSFINVWQSCTTTHPTSLVSPYPFRSFHQEREIYSRQCATTALPILSPTTLLWVMRQT